MPNTLIRLGGSLLSGRISFQMQHCVWAQIALVATTALAGFSIPLGSQADVAIPAAQRLDTVRAQTSEAHKHGDAAAYLASSQAMRQLLNESPNSILQVMSAQAFAGDAPAALDSLAKFIAMGQSNQQAFASKQFDSVRTMPRFNALVSEMRKNDVPVANASKVFQFPEPGIVPEDIDYDPATRQFFVTSVLKKQILVLNAKGQPRTFAAAPDGWPMMALKIDSRSRTLWATEVAIRGFASIPKADWQTSAILIYNLDSGKLLHRIPGPQHTTLGDMTLTRDGDAIISDNDGGIYRVGRDSLALERIDRGDFISPQTPVVSPDGRTLFVPDYLRGIGRIDLAARHVTWLDGQGRYALAAIDGLYLRGRTIIATQNGTSPERVICFRLDRSLTRIESESVAERATPTLGDPTHGVIVDDWFYYLANSGWDALEDDGTPKPGTAPSPSLLMRVKLSGK